MEMTTLGRTGLKVSRLGVGLSEIRQLEGASGTDMVGRILNEALDAGINFLDTAECYGNSEALIGNTVAHRRSEFVLATKAGHVSTGLSGTPWTGQTVRENIGRSLELLKTDYVDLVQLHAFDVTAPPPDDVIEALLKAKEAGKTRFVGYSQEDDEAEWAIRSGLFDTLQTGFNLLVQDARYGLFERARAKGVGINRKTPHSQRDVGQSLGRRAAHSWHGRAAVAGAGDEDAGTGSHRRSARRPHRAGPRLRAGPPGSSHVYRGHSQSCAYARQHRDSGKAPADQ